jgi:hypothetical protein
VKWVSRDSAPTLSSPAGGLSHSLELGIGFWSSGSGIPFRSEGYGLIGVGSGRCPCQREQGIGAYRLGVCVSGCSCFYIWELSYRNECLGFMALAVRM